MFDQSGRVSGTVNLATSAVVFTIFMNINFASAEVWRCVEKLSTDEPNYIVWFDLSDRDNTVVYLKHINLKTNEETKGPLSLAVIHKDAQQKIAIDVQSHSRSMYYFDLTRLWLTRSIIAGHMFESNPIQSSYECKIEES